MTDLSPPRLSQRLFNGFARKRRTAIAGLAILYLGAGAGLLRLSIDSDLLCSLPPGDPEVQLMRNLERRFGILSTALVGVTADDLFSAPALQALRAISRGVAKVPGVAHTQSITEVLDVEANSEGSTIAPLIKDIPADAAALAALRAKVLTRDGVAGNLVSERGDAALVVIQLEAGADAPKVAAAIREIAQQHAGPLRLNYTGAPVVADFIAQEAPRRVAIFFPGALLAVLTVLLAFSGSGPRRARHLWMPLLSGTTALYFTASIIAVMGASLCNMNGLGFALPFVLGLSAGAVISRRGVAMGGPAIAGGALITSAALCVLGVFPETRVAATIGAIGALMALLAATLIGAAAAVDRSLEADGALAPVAAPRGRAVALGAVFAIFALGGAAGLLRLEAPTSGNASFGEKDEPRVAERFLANHFGFGETIFVELQGDLTKPPVVRAVEQLEEDLYALGGVTTVQAVTIPMRLTHQSFTNRRQLPGDEQALRQLWAMLDGNKDIATLVDRERRRAMLLVQLAPGETRVTARKVQELVAQNARLQLTELRAGTPELTARLPGELARRLASLAMRYRGKPPADLETRARNALAKLGPSELGAVVEKAAAAYFDSDEAIVSLRAEGEPKETAAARIKQLAAELTPLVLARGAPADAVPILVRNLPPATAKEDAPMAPKAALFVFERARSAVMDAVTGTLAAALDPGARPTQDVARATRYDAELRTMLFTAMDATLVVRTPQAAGAEPMLVAAATGPSLAVLSADRAQRRSMGWGAIAALLAALVLTLAVRRSLWSAGAALPGFVAALTAVGALGIAGIPTDPTIVALVTLALGAGVFAGLLALPEGGTSHGASQAVVPLLAAAALFAALLASGFVPLQRFGAVAALALIAAAAGAAWVSAYMASQRH